MTPTPHETLIYEIIDEEQLRKGSFGCMGG